MPLASHSPTGLTGAHVSPTRNRPLYCAPLAPNQYITRTSEVPYFLYCKGRCVLVLVINGEQLYSKILRRVTLAILITCVHKSVNSVRPPAVKQCSNSKSFNKNDNLLIYITFVAQQKCPHPAIHGCS